MKTAAVIGMIAAALGFSSMAAKSHRARRLVNGEIQPNGHAPSFGLNPLPA
jgi:hypothetical protein